MSDPTEANLEAAVSQWCKSVVAKGGVSSATIDELGDHLYCEIERNLAAGFTQSVAFALATEKLGEPASLGAEFAKNRTLVSKIVCLKSGAEGIETEGSSMSRKKLLQITIANLVLFAFIILATAWILDGTGYFSKVSMLMYALWFGTYMSFSSVLRRSEKSEWNCLKDKFLTLVGRN